MAESQTILLVEDDAFWRKAFGDALHTAGFQVRTVDDGGAAVHELVVSPPDLLVADFYLPKVDGARLCEFVKSQATLKHIPTIVVSGGLLGVGRDTLPHADAAIAKGPLEKIIPQLIEVVRNLLAGEQLEEYRRAIVEPALLATRDLTRKLRKLKEHMDTLHARLVEVFCEIDGSRRIIGLNPSGEALVGKPEHDLLGRDVLEVFGLEAGNPLAAAVDAALGPEGESTAIAIAFALGDRRLEATVSRMPFGPDDFGAVIVARVTPDREPQG